MKNGIKETEGIEILDQGPFYHGTKADLRAGDLLTPGFQSNYKPEITMNHIYFTALVNGAGLAAALAKGDGPERVYIVEPTGSQLHAQSYYKNITKDKVSLVDSGQSVTAHLLADDADLSAFLNKTYYWYSANKINSTQGGYSGRLLDGLYTAYVHQRA